jgi:hypothetical protein
MEINGHLPVQSERHEIWTAIFDENAWKEVLEAEKFEQLEEHLYEMTVNVDFAVLKGSHTARLVYSEVVKHESTNFNIENELLKKVAGSFELKNPEDVPLPEGSDAHPEGTRMVLAYRLEMDAGNPFVNAALEAFKGKIREGLEEMLQRLESTSREQE